ncbi:hypothetical protein ACFY97_18545 [Streptomyces klenkii]|uniref:DUF7341 domain-containing protein n=1 Tax=Streptomyces klenkii TaxID=1420899 RepID=UPI0036E22B14
MYDSAAPDSWPCAICGRPARARVHDGCRRRLDHDLTELPTLYRQLADALEPGRAGGDGRTSSRTAPLPVNLDALDLRAPGSGIEGTLTSWERDVRDLLGWSPPPFRGSVEQQVDGAASLLCGNLTWICDEHPAVGDFAREIREVAGHARALTVGERPERRIILACLCGSPLTVTLSTTGVKCPFCSQQYGFTEIRILLRPFTERRVA